MNMDRKVDNPQRSFAEQIELNQTAESVSPETFGLTVTGGKLEIRGRGGFITGLELTSPTTDDVVPILYAGEDRTVAKLSASHAMMPAGPYDGIGGQHGYPRWADYEFTPSGEGAGLLVAEGDADVLGYEKHVGLTSSTFTSRSVTHNNGSEPEQTSLGEHYYFTLEDGIFDGLLLDGRTLDEVFGEGALANLKEWGVLVLDDFREAAITFPAGHSIRLSAGFEGDTSIPVGLWVWHRQGTPSVCFEPVVGVKDTDNQGITIAPGQQAALDTNIELL